MTTGPVPALPDDTTTPLDAALAYAARGWRVVPIAPGTKYPRGLDAWQRAATTDPDTIRAWWTGLYQGHGVGIATGRASGLWVLDVDVADGKAGDETLADLQARHGQLPDTPTSITGSGGAHLLFAWHPDHDVRNSASTRLGPGLDIRGEGGFIVAPPTVHPNGTRYEWDAATEHLELAAAPEWLYELLAPPVVEQAPARPLAAPGSHDERPGDIWARTTDWADILGADGWQLHHVDRSGERHWTRPGKELRDGTSATTGYTDADTLKVFTSSLAHMGLAPEETYTKLGYLAATRHHGDHGAAASWLAAQGHRAPEVDLDELLEHTEPEPIVLPPIEERPMAEVVPIRPLADVKPLPVWPTHALPSWVRAHVEASAARLQVPVDLCAQLAIGTLASICMGKARVTVDTWTEPLNLYAYCAMHSGAGKSPAEKAIVSPLREWEASHRVSTEDDHRFAVAAWKVTQKRYKDMEDSVVRGSVSMDDPEYRQLVLDAAQPKPTPFRLTVDDSTPERLVQLLAAHRRLALISTEAGLLDMVAGQISRGGTPNIDVYLKAWSGETIQRDRKGGEDGPESTVVTDALLSVVLTIQPSVITKYQATSPELRGRGFFARFMPSVPRSLVGTRRHGQQRAPGPEADAYRDQLHALAHTMDTTMPVQLTPTPGAAAMFYRWCDTMEAQLAPGGRLAALHDASSKIKSSVLRVAGLLTVAEGEWRSIDEPIMARAIEVGDYWTEHALYVEGASEATEVEDEHALRMARAIVDWARRKEVLEVDPRQVYLSRRRGLSLRGVEELAPGFELLVARGWAQITHGSVADIGVPRVKVRARLEQAALEGFTESEQASTESAQPRAMRADCLIGEKASSSSFSRVEHPTGGDPQSARIARGIAEEAQPVDNPETIPDDIKAVF